MKLKIMISIIPNEPTNQLTQFCKEENIKHVHLTGPKAKNPMDFHIEPQKIYHIIQAIYFYFYFRY